MGIPVSNSGLLEASKIDLRCAKEPPMQQLQLQGRGAEHGRRKRLEA